MSASALPSSSDSGTETLPADTDDNSESILQPVVDRPVPVHFRSDPAVVLQSAQFLLLFLAALYLTRPIVLPIVLAILLKLALQPVVRRLERWHVPRSVAALIMIFAMFIPLVSMGTALTGPAHSWAA